MNKSNKVTIYLNEAVKKELVTQADYLGIPLSTYIKILLNTGIDLSKAMERSIKNGK